MSAGCLFSGNPHPCEPCAWHFSGPGSCHLPFSASHRSPSCGTCGGGRSPICCSVVKAERLKEHLSPRSWQQPPCHPFWGWPWKNSHSCCHLPHCLVCHPGLWRPSWRRTQGTPFCGCAVPKKRRMPVSGIIHICSSHCSA